MTRPETDQTHDFPPGPGDDRVMRALEEYETELRAGRTPDRAALLARYADVREALDECLDGLDFIHLPDEPAESPAADRPAGEALTQRPLGDYQLVREVGRGGMGVVYEAVQLSLGRRVALKVLPFAAALDARKLQRFKHEAEAAALFHHPNIVPVYAVGCERGVHFYVMQFVDGQDLASLIRDLREGDGRPAAADAPTRAALATERSVGTDGYVRGVAKLGAQVAAALDHAHAEGVVHRDIKPANLMVDGRGNPWITDFGLARLHDGDLTATGDVLGTIRYMSPEQAQGKKAEVDHRTDVYSLGATLYELLTLRPPFDGATKAEVLTKVLRDDPAAVRRFNPVVPADLETIILKAMAKDPVERYPTAQALADDLLRFLDHRPVLARRPTVRQRVSRWARHHQLVVWTAGAAAALCTGVLAVTLGVVWDARQDAVRALASEKDARQDVVEALAREKQARDDAERALKSEQAARAGLGRNVALTFDVLGKFTPAQTRRFPTGPVPAENRPAMEAALGMYLKFAEANRDAPAERGLAADASRRAALILIRLGRPAEAEAPLRAAVKLGEQAAAEFPDQPAPRFVAGVAYGDLGYVLVETGRPAEGLAAHRKSVETLRAVAAAPSAEPEHRRALANALSNVGGLLQNARRLDESEPYLRESLDVRRALAAATGPDDPETRSVVAEAAYELAVVLTGLGRFDEAEPLFREVIEDQRRLAADQPAFAPYRAELGASLQELSRLLSRAGRPAEAEAALREAVDIFTKLAAEAPREPEYRTRLSFQLHNLGILLLRAGRPADAAAEYARAAELRARLAEEFPGDPDHRFALGQSLKDQGLVLSRAGRGTEAEAPAVRAVEVLEGLVAEQPKSPEFRQTLVDAQLVLYAPLFDAGKTAEAERAARRAAELAGQLVREQPANALYTRFLAYALRHQGRALERLGKAREAHDAFRRALGVTPNDPDVLAGLADLLADAAEVRDPARAVELAGRASDLAPRSGPAWSALGLALYRNGDPAAAACAAHKAAALPGGGRRERLLLALAQAARGDPAGGRRWYDLARPDPADRRPADPPTERLAAEARAVFDSPPTK